jgi:sarcosine oxidase subunit beta
MIPESADVVVMGGGVIGASIAYHLARRGIKAVVLEKGDPVAGSSGACDGLVFMQSKKPGIHLKLALESRKRFETLAHELDYPIEFETPGGMVVIDTDDEMAAMEKFVYEQKAVGLAVDLLDGKEARKLEPALSAHIAGATFSCLDAQVNPIALTVGFLKAAQRLGSVYIARCGAEGIEVSQGRVTGVRTARGTIHAPIAVCACGVGSPEIGETMGLAIPIKPRRGQLLVTERMPRLIGHCMISARYIAAKFDPELARLGGEGLSLEQTQSGNILIGSTREFAGFDRRNTIDGISGIARYALTILPGLKDVHIIRTFAGLRPYTPDGLPVLGTAPEPVGLILAAGHEGDGIALSPITGQLIAELIDTGTTAISLDDFRLERFKPGH